MLRPLVSKVQIFSSTKDLHEEEAEEEEESPNLYLTIRDKKGNLVRRLRGPGGAGFSGW